MPEGLDKGRRRVGEELSAWTCRLFTDITDDIYDLPA